MGFLIDGSGPFDFEERRESFVIHANDGAGEAYAFWNGYPHPEVRYEDLDRLIEGLQYLKRRRDAGEDGRATPDLIERGVVLMLDKQGAVAHGEIVEAFADGAEPLVESALRNLVAAGKVESYQLGLERVYSLT